LYDLSVDWYTFGTTPSYESSLSPKEKSLNLIILAIRVAALIYQYPEQTLKFKSHFYPSHKPN
jgi:hypothetical protein